MAEKQKQVHDKNVCGAKTRAGTPCQRPAGWGTDHVGIGRCKLHGGKSTGPPKKNKNAVTTGEFETLFFDTLDDEEKELIYQMQIEKKKLLEQEIQLLTVRERRMLKRIADLKDKEMTVVSIKKGIEKGYDTNIQEMQGVLGQIQSVEDALTRVQEKKQKAIEMLHRFEMDEEKLALDKLKIHGDDDDEIGDDGFIEALEGKVGEVWGDEES